MVSSAYKAYQNQIVMFSCGHESMFYMFKDGTDTTMLARWRLVLRLMTAPGPCDTMAGPREQTYPTNRVAFPTNCSRTVDAALQTVLQTSRECLQTGGFLNRFINSEPHPNGLYGL